MDKTATYDAAIYNVNAAKLSLGQALAVLNKDSINSDMLFDAILDVNAILEDLKQSRKNNADYSRDKQVTKELSRFS